MRKNTYPISIDYVISLADGGTNNIDNIQPLCLKCNLVKNKKSIDYKKGLHLPATWEHEK